MKIDLVKDLIENFEQTPSILVDLKENDEASILSKIGEFDNNVRSGSTWRNESDNILNSESIIMLICLSFGLFLIILFILYIGYYFSWWRFYNRIACLNCANLALCNCIYCYHTCPLFEAKAKRLSLNCRNNQFGSSSAPRMFVQDLIATNDGRVIKLTDLREINNSNSDELVEQTITNSSSQVSSPKSILKTTPSIRSSNYVSQADLV